MAKRNSEMLLRALFGLWGAVLVVLSFAAVAICDSCGGGGDQAFRWLGALSGALAILLAVLRGVTDGLRWSLFAIQLGLVVAAYETAGAGSGSVRISPVLAIVGGVLETTGAAALATNAQG
jgi:hypothetical protein